MTILLTPLFRLRENRWLLRLLCACLLTAAWAISHAASAPFWIDAGLHTRAGRILASGSEMRGLLAAGDRVLVQWPQQEPAFAISTSPSHPGGECSSPMAGHYRILRTLPTPARTTSIWKGTNTASASPTAVLVQPIGTARLATQHAAAPQAMVDILQAADAIRPGDLLLALDSPQTTQDTADDAPSPCKHP